MRAFDNKGAPTDFKSWDSAGERRKEEKLTFKNLNYDERKHIRFDDYTNLPHVHGDRNQPHIAEIEKFELAIRKLLDEIGLEDENYIVVTLVPKTGGEFVTIESAEITLEAC
ncbi:hypothetical protein P3S68_000983 [Capsicum galapagoense]